MIGANVSVCFVHTSVPIAIAIGIIMVISDIAHHLLGLHMYTKGHCALMGLLICLLDLPQNQHCGL